MRNSREILELKEKIEQKAREAYMMGKQLDITPLMSDLQLDYFANVSRIRELLEKKMGELPLDGTIELCRDVDFKKQTEEKNNSSGEEGQIILG